MTQVNNHEQVAIFRLLDANANRASEGLRVLEEFVRFAWNDSFLSCQLKLLRHNLSIAVTSLLAGNGLICRDTLSDPGTSISLASEQTRINVQHVLRANFSRVQQALRVMEEYGKVLSPQFATVCETSRYETYVLEKAVLGTMHARERLLHARLYVLVSGGASVEEFADHVKTLVAGGCHILQLRDKDLSDGELLTRAKLLREMTKNTNTLFIMNDRPDIALLSNADGVHIGQNELPINEVRKIIGTEKLVGVSTHTLEQARQAVLEGASYIGCGPTFPSQTKAFDAFPGLNFLKQVAAEIALPSFAIGGIHLENVADVLSTGFTRIAISNALANSSIQNVHAWLEML